LLVQLPDSVNINNCLLKAKSEVKGPIGKARHRSEDNIKMDIQEVECGGMGRIELVQDRKRCWPLVNAVMNIRVPLNWSNFLTT
jgi:hypothetical protein